MAAGTRGRLKPSMARASGASQLTRSIPARRIASRPTHRLTPAAIAEPRTTPVTPSWSSTTAMTMSALPSSARVKLTIP